MLRRYVRPILGQQVLAGMRPLDIQGLYHQMSEQGLSARTVRYAHVVVKSAMQQAVKWRLLIENPADGVKVQQLRNEMYRAESMERYSRLRDNTLPWLGISLEAQY